MNDDEELIASVVRGDDTALRELFSRHASWLAARLRAVLPAAEVEDRTIAEVAELTGVPEGTVKSRAHWVRQLMRAALTRREPAQAGGGR